MKYEQLKIGEMIQSGRGFQYLSSSGSWIDLPDDSWYIDHKWTRSMLKVRRPVVDGAEEKAKKRRAKGNGIIIPKGKWSLA